MKDTDFAYHLTRFLTVYLPSQRGIKMNTQLSYRDTFSLFLEYCKSEENIQPESLRMAGKSIGSCYEAYGLSVLHQ